MTTTTTPTTTTTATATANATLTATVAALAAAAALTAAPVSAAADAKQAAPTLSASLAPLAPMLGEWDCFETYHAGGFSPNEAYARGIDVIRVGPGGNAVIADYYSSGDFGPYFAHDMITWDDAAQRFHYLFIDSFGPAVQLHHGQAAGAAFVFEGPFSLYGKPGTMRRTYKDITAGSSTLVVDFIDQGGVTTKLVTIRKQRRR